MWTVPSNDNNNNNTSSDGVELMLGLQGLVCLRDYHAILDLRRGEMRILVSSIRKNQQKQQQQEEVVIPFLLPRSRNDACILPLGDHEDDECDDQYNSDLESSNSAEPIDMSGV
jgi:hypothetical protein